jgi:hypothetical protein
MTVRKNPSASWGLFMTDVFTTALRTDRLRGQLFHAVISILSSAAFGTKRRLPSRIVGKLPSFAQE